MKQTAQLQKENNKLNQDLLNVKAQIDSPDSHPHFNIDTPIDKTLALLTRIQNGGQPPSKEEIQNLKRIIVNAENLRRPADLQQQLLEDGMLD